MEKVVVFSITAIRLEEEYTKTSESNEKMMIMPTGKYPPLPYVLLNAHNPDYNFLTVSLN
jgi:hypothetical protein